MRLKDRVALVTGMAMGIGQGDRGIICTRRGCRHWNRYR